MDQYNYNNSLDAFFFGLAQGVARFAQSEGGSPGSPPPKMSFLYLIYILYTEYELY